MMARIAPMIHCSEPRILLLRSKAGGDAIAAKHTLNTIMDVTISLVDVKPSSATSADCAGGPVFALTQDSG